ncbi:GIY-YIG nuclease family protein [Neisseria arctica]|nr:GIY-YIG nuclease family protein [Neisseria arctica]UOO87183.1 GIY-YIG nuclease family protein [Neisseria arctica]
MSKPRSQTIRIFLPDGNPRSIRKVERSSNSNIRLFDIPRAELGKFCQMNEAANMGIYLLLGDGQLYIGQTSDLGARLKTHDKNKPFWQRAFAVVLNNDFRTFDHLYYLEKTAIEHVQKAGRLVLENGTAGNNHRHLHDSIRSDCENIFDEIETLLAVLNQDFFTEEKAAVLPEICASGVVVENGKTLSVETTADERLSENNREIFYCKRGVADARGFLHEDGKQFIVMAGSLINSEYASYAPRAIEILRQQWLSEGLLSPVNSKQYRLNQDQIFSSVSYAAVMVIGKNANGRAEWKNASGRTFKECYPQESEK